MERKQICIIGIDPGKNGGIAAQAGDAVEVKKMFASMSDFRIYLQEKAEKYTVIVFIEKLNVRRDDMTYQGGQATLAKIYRIQKLIQNYEQLKAVMDALDITYVLCHPMTWQSRLGLRLRGIHEEKSDRKRRYRDNAQKFFPNVKCTLWNADALQIMRYGIYAMQYRQSWVMQNIPVPHHERFF